MNFLLIGISLKAQPTLTATGCNPYLGQTFSMVTTSGTPISAGNSGANQTWNLSSITGTPTGTITMVAPSATPYAASFASANLAYATNGGGVGYLSTSSTYMRVCGLGSPSATIAYNDLEDILHFPFTYNNTFTDTYSAVFVTTQQFYRRGTMTATADGYGTLITPNGTYTNVLRVHYVEVSQDSTDLGGFPYTIDYQTDQYTWFKEGTHKELASVYTSSNSVSADTYGGSYLTGNVGIDDIDQYISSSAISPNPASDIIKLDLTLTTKKGVIISVFNSIGQNMKMNQTSEGILGDNSIQLDIANLPEGIYYAQITLDNTTSLSKKFVVVK
jgi:hypothetical protein